MLKKEVEMSYIALYFCGNCGIFDEYIGLKKQRFVTL